MFHTTLPAGNHIIVSVQYIRELHSTQLMLCCELIAHLTMLETAQYKPECGDYYIVTDHGTASVVKKNVFEGATKPRMKLNLDMFSMPLLDPRAIIGVSTMFGTSFPLERTTAKPETMGMREENGYVDKVKPAAAQDADKVKDVIVPEDFGVLPENRSAALRYAEYYASEKWASMQNIIKSLTAQNEKKQVIINEQRKMFNRQQDISKQLNNLIDTCAAAKLI